MFFQAVLRPDVTKISLCFASGFFAAPQNPVVDCTSVKFDTDFLF